MPDLSRIDTPAAIIDAGRMHANILRMQQRMDELGVRFRPHVKTAKCWPVARAQLEAGAKGITVSTIKEAEQFFAHGVADILYAVGITAAKLPKVLALRRQGCDLKIVTDNAVAAGEIVAFGKEHGETFEVWIEVDCDGHRSGIRPDEHARLIEVARILNDGGMVVGGVMTHAGSSYDLDTPAALEALAEQERSGCVLAANHLRDSGIPCPVVSIGSTPTALYAKDLAGVTEIRAGVYAFFDLVMYNVGACRMDDIALSVLTTVIGHQADKGWAIVDAGWMAMSRDRGTQKQKRDFGFGQVCTVDGTVLPGYIVSGANQEHGIVSCESVPDREIEARFPVGTLLRILPNHACATGAQFPEYHALTGESDVAVWDRFYGW